MPAPPPMRFVSRDERSVLNNARDPKARLRTTLELANDHLVKVEEFSSAKNFEQASEELGRYLGLLEDAQSFLFALNSGKNNTRDLYKHAEIGLRPLGPRLAVVRRVTPVEYAVNIKTAEDYTRDLRSRILDSFYGPAQLRDRPPEAKKPEDLKEPPQGIKQP
jgi:hypothetical protein